MKTRAIEKFEILERNGKKKEYRIGGLGEIYGHLLGSNFDFSQQSVVREGKEALSLFFFLLAESIGKGAEGERRGICFGNFLNRPSILAVRTHPSAVRVTSPALGT